MLTGKAVLTIEKSALEQLASLLLERAGLKITPDGYYGLKLAISARMPALGLADGDDYVRRLRERAGEAELRALLPLVTVGKTEFFRDARQFKAIEKKLFPDLLAQARREQQQVRIWSAGCATGEEPYSLAMAAVEAGFTSEEIDIWATDLNPVAVESARLGRFSAKRMMGVSPERLKRFFHETHDGYEVLPILRKYTRFEGVNLAAPVFPKVRPGSLDMVLCRNVIIYFDLPTIRGLMDRFHQALRPQGVLLLGYSESLFKVYDRFEMFEVEGSFAYRRPAEGKEKKKAREAKETKAAAAPPSGAKTRAADLKLHEEPPRRTRAAERPPPEEPRPRARRDALRSPIERLEEVAKRVERGDFAEALEQVKALSDDQPNDLAAILTLGNIYSLMGDDAHAQEAFSLALLREPLCVEARIFGGVAAMQANRHQEAKEELTKALFLEPSLALGHYLLAQAYERLGAHDSARKSYRNAIEQLRFPQRTLAGFYPDMPDTVEAMARAARYALAALEENL